MDLRALKAPIVQAPLAGGASTPRSPRPWPPAAGSDSLRPATRRPRRVAADIRELRALSDAPFGVNIFAPPAPPTDPAAVTAYAASLAAEASRYGTSTGEPRHDDDHFDAKLELTVAERPAVVSFTFGCPQALVVTRLHEAGCDVWVTVTSPDEAELAAAAGADALVLQGLEAGGHRGGFSDPPQYEEFGLLSLLRLVADRVPKPLVASGGIADGAAVAAVLSAGAAAAQIGTALMLSPEAGTASAYRDALKQESATSLTRAFSGRRARGIVNRFMLEHEDGAPVAYPDVHYLTTPIRAAAREAGDAEAINLWAGQTHTLATEEPAAEIVRRLTEDARASVAEAAERLGDSRP